MNKKIWLAVVAVLILLGVGGYFVLGSKKDSDNNSTKESSGSTEVASTKKNLNTSLDELAKLGENMQCSFTYSDPSTGMTSSGTVYVGGSKMRGEFTANDPTSGEMKSNMINDGTYLYTWMDGSQGSKFKIPETGESAATETGDSTQNNEPVDTNQNYEFNCDKWNVDESFFTPPGNVEFVDLTAQQQQLQEATGGSSPAVSSETCAQISDPEAQQACLNAIQ